MGNPLGISSMEGKGLSFGGERIKKKRPEPPKKIPAKAQKKAY